MSISEETKNSYRRICIVAEGKADIYPQLRPTVKRYTSTRRVVNVESGCDVKIFSRKPSRFLVYNGKVLINSNLVVAKKILIAL